jgi:hypothetical protein
MKMFVIAAAATLVGCTCAMPPQFATSECAEDSGLACLDRTTAMPPIEPTPAVPRHDVVAKDAKAAVATKTPKRSGQSSSRSEPANNPKAPIAAEAGAKGPARLDDNSDPIINRAKVAVSAKMEEDPSSIELVAIRRGIRKNTLGVPLDTICGYVKEKTVLGRDADQRPFLYLVKENDAYIVNGSGDITAAAAYHNICN